METFRQIPGSMLAAVVFFVLGETGFVRQRSSFAAAWVVGVLVVGAVLFGTPDRAEAGYCGGTYIDPYCMKSLCDSWCNANFPPCILHVCTDPNFCSCFD